MYNEVDKVEERPTKGFDRRSQAGPKGRQLEVGNDNENDKYIIREHLQKAILETFDQTKTEIW